MRKVNLDVSREAMESEEPALVLDAVEGRVPSDRLADIGHAALDERVEVATDLAFPAWHGRDVGLYRRIPITFRNLGIAARKEFRFHAGTKRPTAISRARARACQRS